MTYNNLPPQAYTKDDIAKAYVWIQGQPDYVRHMATSKETLVALYLQSRRNGNNISFEKSAPVSSKDFKSQLKNLASELNQFEDTKSAVVESKMSVPVLAQTFKPTSHPTPTVTTFPHSEPSESADAHPLLPPKAPPSELVKNLSEETITSFVSKNDAIQKTLEEFKSRPQSYDNPLPSTALKKTFQFQIDPRSEQILRSVKAQLNMESEHDIIRMLLVLGFDRIKELFPQPK